MKTSTKLLIIFLACIPASLWAYNSLLKKQLQAHNIVLELRPDPAQQYTEVKLPSFKYIVINGALTFGSKNDKITNWLPKIRLGDSFPNRTNSINILKPYADIVKHRIAHDTLYISFHKNAVYDEIQYPFYDPDIVKIMTNDLYSLDATYGKFSVSGWPKAKNLNINIDGKSYVDLNGLSPNSLNLTIKDSSFVNVEFSNINNFYYNLPHKGKLTVDVYSAKHFHPGNIDSLAWINVQGKARELKQLLKP